MYFLSNSLFQLLPEHSFQWIQHFHSQLVQKLYLIIYHFLKIPINIFAIDQYFFNSLTPNHLQSQQTSLTWLFLQYICYFVLSTLCDLLNSLFQNDTQSILHLFIYLLKPHLNSRIITHFNSLNIFDSLSFSTTNPLNHIIIWRY